MVFKTDSPMLAVKYRVNSSTISWRNLVIFRMYTFSNRHTSTPGLLNMLFLKFKIGQFFVFVLFSSFYYYILFCKLLLQG